MTCQFSKGACCCCYLLLLLFAYLFQAQIIKTLELCQFIHENSLISKRSKVKILGDSPQYPISQTEPS